jgi:hypothetical protein
MGRRADEDEAGPEPPPSLRTEGPEWRPQWPEHSERQHRRPGAFGQKATPNPALQRIAARWRIC